MSTDNITLDIETIPTQNRVHIEAITSKVQAELNDKVGRLTEEHDNVQPPGSVKDPEKIAEAIAKKRAAILQEIEAAKVEAAQKLEEQYRKTSLDGGMGQLAVCSLAFGENEPFALYERDWKAPGYEKKVLLKINEAIDQHCKHRRGQMLIGHNIIRFDRKFLRQRGIINGVVMHRLISEEVKPWDKGVVYDTMTAWTGDPREFISMNTLCQILGLPGKGDDIDGSKVWDYVAAGRIDEVAAYCNDDVRRTYAMFERLRGIKPVVFEHDQYEAVEA